MTRRRRLTIAVLVLLILGGGLWWSTRPRIDPRLVGTWTADWGPYGIEHYDFCEDGRLWLKGDPFSRPHRWRVSDSVLFVSADRDADLWTRLRILKLKVRKEINGKSTSQTWNELTIDSVAASEIKLSNSAGERAVLIRNTSRRAKWLGP
ncbi:hypothetical protein Pan44_29440 [Caulifigura coniformis]|uniref:Uncharacterized protein n=1 Tax=Caulifigura coniformis TaxID=2527983 RepID=A0A517SFK4_9PLAN|nr:hypothetical protein [Caulifigura coniformis]QDT54905.1 hypothetical protein Pan44_29440 [Caulifigura coniformis]